MQGSLEYGDVLFNRTNSRELVGKTGVWDSTTFAIFASYFIRLRLKKSILNPFYFAIYMNLPMMKRHLKELARGAIGQANINAKELSSIKIFLPPVQQQNIFAEKVQEIRTLISDQEEALKKLNELFYATLNSVFSSNQ